MTSPTVTDLAFLAQRLTGPCRETDALIWWQINRKAAERIYWNAATGLPKPLGDAIPAGLGKLAVEMNAPKFTESLDAAMTLKPDGCYVDTQERYRIHRDLEYTDHSWARVESADGGKFLGEATAKTVPLAIVSAILRARASMEAHRG
jgi:hypothetical protein